MAFYRRDLPHIQRDHTPHFITFVTKHRHTLPNWARDIVLAACKFGHAKKYNLYVVVVMPDHVHAILTPGIDNDKKRIVPLHEITKAIKSFSAHEINRQSGQRGSIWQDESFDHVLRSSESLDAKIDYVLQNPVRRGLVSIATDYRWSWRKE